MHKILSTGQYLNRAGWRLRNKCVAHKAHLGTALLASELRRERPCVRLSIPRHYGAQQCVSHLECGGVAKNARHFIVFGDDQAATATDMDGVLVSVGVADGDSGGGSWMQRHGALPIGETIRVSKWARASTSKYSAEQSQVGEFVPRRRLAARFGAQRYRALPFGVGVIAPPHSEIRRSQRLAADAGHGPRTPWGRWCIASQSTRRLARVRSGGRRFFVR